MSKNAISALQEFLQKNSQPLPKYDIITTATSSFTYRVTCQIRDRFFSATGESNNKQTAKHHAAENIITQLKNNSFNIPYQSEININESSEESSFSSSPLNEINVIGRLQEHCVKRRYVMPSYSEGSYTQGHSNFRMTCTLGAYQVDGISNGKKKQAKYACAKKMLEDLQKMTEDQITQYNIRAGTVKEISKTNFCQTDDKACGSKDLSIDSPVKTDYVIKKALSLFPKLTKNHTVSVDSAKVKLSLYHIYFKNSLSSSQLKKFFEFYQIINLRQIQGDISKLSTALNEICIILNITKEESIVRTKDGKTYAVVIKITTNPEFSDVGIADNYSDARLNVHFRMIRTIFYLLI